MKRTNVAGRRWGGPKKPTPPEEVAMKEEVAMNEKKHLTAERRFNTKPILGRARDLSKLPRWAADELRRLEADLKSAEKKVAAMSAPEGSRIVVDPYSNNQVGLVERAIIRFKFDNSNGFIDVEGWIDVSIRDGVLKINASDSILVHPSATNDLAISLLNSTVDNENVRRAKAKRVHGIKGDAR